MHPSVAAIYICLFAAMTHIQWQLLPLTLEMRLRHISKPLSPCTRMTSWSAWVTSQAIIPTIYHLGWSHGGQCLLLRWERDDWSSRNYHLGKWKVFEKHAKIDLKKDLSVFNRMNSWKYISKKTPKTWLYTWVGWVIHRKTLDVLFFPFFFTPVIKLYQLHFGFRAAQAPLTLLRAVTWWN